MQWNLRYGSGAGGYRTSESKVTPSISIGGNAVQHSTVSKRKGSRMEEVVEREKGAVDQIMERRETTRS